MAIIKSGTTAQVLVVDPVSAAARVSIYNTDGSFAGAKPTYRAVTPPFAAAVTANVPFFLIEGSATKTIVINRIVVSGMSLTAVQYVALQATKYSTVAAGGTATLATMVPLDSAFAAATAAFVKYYTAGPTPGTLVGAIATIRFVAQATIAGAAGLTDDVLFSFGDMLGTRGIVLRGTTQGLGLVFPIAPATAATMSVAIEWTEE